MGMLAVCDAGFVLEETGVREPVIIADSSTPPTMSGELHA